MKRLPFLLLLAASLLIRAEEPSAPNPPPGVSPNPKQEAKSAPLAWLGIHLTKPEESTVAHLPALPPGIGFVIRSVEPDGPSQASDLRPMDILWKFEDQMLVNEAQLATLLRLRTPGDQVTLSIFRGGQPLEISLTLGTAPATLKGSLRADWVDASILPGDHSPMRVVNVSTRTARYQTDDGNVELRRDGDQYKLIIRTPDSQVLLDTQLDKDGEMDQVPKEWRRRVCALRRVLDHALDERMVQVRPPRPRVITPAAKKP